MFITERRHRAEVGALTSTLIEREAAITELEGRIESQRRGFHDVIEATRYTLVDAASLLRAKDAKAGEDLHELAESLPYVLSGYHLKPKPIQWEAVGRELPKERAGVERIAREHGIALPAEPREALIILMEIASVLMHPERSPGLDYYRGRHRVPTQEAPL